MTPAPRTVAGAVVAAAAVAALAGCAGPNLAGLPAGTAPSAAPTDQVAAEAECGVRQVFRRGHWWVGSNEHAPLGIGSTPGRPVTPITGTITETGPGRARFTSPALPRPAELTASPEQRPDRLPLGECIQ